MPVRNFGPSTLWATRTDVPNSTPIKFGALQDFTLDYKGTTKELMGQGVFADAVGRSAIKITGKAKYGWVHGGVFSSLFFGAALTTGQLTTANAEAAVVPGATAYTVTVANAATYFSDNGVSYAATAIPLQQVAAAPVAGQYSVNATTGVYTFAAADANAAILISYTYKVTTSGQQMTISQTLQGIQPVFQIVNERVYNGPSGLEKVVYTLNACVADDLSAPTKMGDFAISDFGFSAFADNSQNVGTININKVT